MKEKKTKVTFKERSVEEPPVVNDTKMTAVAQIKAARTEDADLQTEANHGQTVSNDRTVRTATAKGPASAKLFSQINRPKVILRRTGSEKSAISNGIILEEELENDKIESTTPFDAQRLERKMSKSSPTASRQPSQIGQQTEPYVNMAETRYNPAGNDPRTQTSYIPDEVRASSKTLLLNVEPEADGMDTIPPLNRLSSGSPSSSFGKVGVMASEKSKLKESWSSTTLSSNAPTDASDEADDHINVVLRVRPLNSQESSRNDKDITSFPGSGKIEIDNNGSMRQFGYNVVFEHEATQADLFDHSGVKKLIDMALNGYACTAVAFGQTGSGKTHTMTGPPQQFQDGKLPDPEMFGIIQRSLKYMFEQLKKQPGQKVIRASYLEIYNEQVIDLLNTNQRHYLAVRWSKNRGFYVENLFVVECGTLDDIMAVLDEGMRNRQTGSHGLNEFSSRSHSMLMLTVDSEQQDPDDENLYITKRGKLTFVDLAGSEKVKDSNSTAETLVESNNINRSLLVLGNCISSLGDPKRRHGHIPYRDSKLTKLLADSLGGNGVTLMVCCITPSSHHASETMNTLRYASRAKKIQTKPVVKMDPREKLILSLKREIKVLKNENHYLRQQLDFPAKPKGQLARQNEENYVKLLQDKEKQNGAKDDTGLYEMLQEYMVENEALRSDNADLQNLRETQKRDQQILYRDNERLLKRVEDLERILKQPSWQNMPRQQGPYPEQYQAYVGDPAQNIRPVPGSGGRTVQSVPNNRLPPPQDLPLRDPVYPGSPPQGYMSPTGRGRPSPQQPRSGQQPMKPPHRLSEPIARQSPHELVNGHPSGPSYQGPPSPVKQDSANRLDSRRSSQSSSTDAIRDLNEKLKQELAHLDGEIYQHQALNSRQRQVYGSQGSIR